MSSSVCREFFDRFPSGKDRQHDQLVEFVLKHPSSRSKIEEWIRVEERERQNAQSSRDQSMRKSDHDDYSSSLGGGGDGRMERSSETTEKSEMLDKYSKSNEISLRERELGNVCFKRKDLQGSLRHYNQAIKFANFPNLLEGDREVGDTEENVLAIALANRSAVYSDLGELFYPVALKDADLALKYGYPERLRAKLFLRKASIFVKQRNFEEAQECLEKIKKESENTEKQSDQDQACTKDIQTQQISLPSSMDSKIKEIEAEIKKLRNFSELCDQEEAKKSSSFQNNVNFENASHLVVIRTSPDVVGRHVIAAEDIQKGELLFREDPFASVLLPDFYDSHCHHCHKPLDDIAVGYFFPCKRCVQVKFCDDICADAGEIYHKYECKWLGLMHSLGIAHLALRIVLVAGVENILHCVENHTLLSDVANLEIFKRGQSNYHRVYSLLDHINGIYTEDLFQYALSAALLTWFLKTKTSFLQGFPLDKQLKIGGAILRHVCQLICNAHAVTDILPENSMNSIVEESQKRIATAIFPAASIMNHSCDPNISFQFSDGRTILVRASRLIRESSQVYNCYGPHFRRMSRIERQEILQQQYFFDCKCDKCSAELVEGNSFADQFDAFACENCEGPFRLPELLTEQNIQSACSSCGHIQSIKNKLNASSAVTDLLKKGEFLMEKGNHWAEAIEVLESCYKLASQTLFKFNSSLGQICDSLARCYVMAGNIDDATKFLKQSLEYVKTRFGEDSVEFSRELTKYQEVSGENK